ncbi:HAMP domain-containing sensor histidine kinase [Geitlerinema splendidum]|jgi:two-component system OmpR family sensor kinase|nr:HAMP domain-containing sensor histidine kinase [Geitlerinema splendidum]
MKIKWQWVMPFLPALLSVLSVLVLDSFGFIEFHLTSVNIYGVIIFSGVITTIVIASFIFMREGMLQARKEALYLARQEYEMERSRFLRRLDHELKNPLTGLQLVLTNTASANDLHIWQKNMDSLQRQVTRLNRIVTDLRKLAMISAQTPEVLPVDLNRLLDDIYMQINEELSDRDLNTIQLSLRKPSQPSLFIYGDYDLLLIAIYNLVNNALKYSRPGDRVAISAFTQDENAVIEVADTGIGISPEDLPYIWDELYRSEKVREIPGSGVGLSLVKLIVERHRGTIDLHSQPDRGTTIRLMLPLMPITITSKPS